MRAYPGAALWATTFVALGYYAGDRWREWVGEARTHAALIAVAAVCVIAAASWKRRTA